MLAIQADMKLLNLMVKTALPKLSNHLETIRLPLDLFATQWLVSLFSASLPPPTVARVWDWLFLDGPSVLLCVSLALLRRAEGDLRSTDDLSVSAEILNGRAQSATDADLLVADARKELMVCEMGGLHLRALRSRHALEVRRQLDSREHMKRLKRRSVGQLVRLTEGTIGRLFSAIHGNNEEPKSGDNDGAKAVKAATAGVAAPDTLIPTLPTSLPLARPDGNDNEGVVYSNSPTHQRRRSRSEDFLSTVESQMAVSDDYVNRNSKIDGGEDYGGGRSGSSGSGGSSSSNGSHNDDLLYEERWTVISRNEFSGDCLTSNLMVDEDYWSRREQTMKTLDLRRQNSSMGICADENSTTRCAEVMSSARQVGEIISSSSVGGSDPPTNLSTLKLVGLVERLHGDFLQLAYRSIQSRREAADALRVQRARDDAEKARQKAAVASAVLDLHYSPHSRKSKAVDAEQQKLVLTQIRHPPLGYPGNTFEETRPFPEPVPPSDSLPTGLSFRVHSDSFRLNEEQFRALMRPVSTFCQIRASGLGSFGDDEEVVPAMSQGQSTQDDKKRYIRMRFRKKNSLPSSPARFELIAENFNQILGEIFLRFCDANKELDWQDFLHCWALLSGIGHRRWHEQELERSERSERNAEVEDKARLCFAVCDRANVGTIDRTELAALLHCAYDIFVAGSNGSSGYVGSNAELNFLQSASAERFGGSNGVFALEDMITPDTVSQILDTCFPPSKHNIGCKGGGDGGICMPSADNAAGASRLTFEQFLDKVQQNHTIADFLLLGNRKCRANSQ
jgi:hypothetical protein